MVQNPYHKEISKGIRFFMPDKKIDVRPFVEAFEQIKDLKRNEFLISPGRNSDFQSFIVEGIFRVFFIDKNGNEVTTWFGFPGMWITDLLSFYKGQKAVYYVQAMEKSKVAIIPKKALQKLYITHPQYLWFAKNFAEYGMIMMMERCEEFQKLTAKERYIKLLDTHLQYRNVPYKHIASFLGITETSLSRIRKNLKKSQKKTI